MIALTKFRVVLTMRTAGEEQIRRTGVEGWAGVVGVAGWREIGGFGVLAIMGVAGGLEGVEETAEVLRVGVLAGVICSLEVLGVLGEEGVLGERAE